MQYEVVEGQESGRLDRANKLIDTFKRKVNWLKTGKMY